MKNIEIFRFFEQRIPNNSVAKLALLNEIKENKDVAEIADFFNLSRTVIDREISEMIKLSKPKQMKKKQSRLLSEAIIAQEVLNERYNQMTPIEQKVIGLIESNDFIRIKRQVKIVERMATNVSGYHREMIKECTNAIKNNAFTLKEAAYKVCELQEAIKDVLKEGSAEFKVPGFKYLKNVSVSCIDDSDAPETIFIEFAIEVYPEGTSYMEIKHSLEGIDRSFRKIGTSIVNTAIFWKDKANQIFTGQFIWDSSVRTNQVSKAGSKVLGKGELALHTVQGNTISFKDLKPHVMEVLKDIDANIVSWLPELEKDTQQISIDYAPEPKRGINRALKNNQNNESKQIDFSNDESIKKYLDENLTNDKTTLEEAPKKFFIGRRDNPQLSKPYFKAYGQLSQTSAKEKEKSAYGSMSLTSYNSEEEYQKALDKIKSDGYSIR